MRLQGQDSSSGYAMAALLVGLSVAAILMTVAMPVWKQMATREKEEELVFRGNQYVRALRLFSTKYANAAPPSLDVLVEQRFIRKKYKDPITNDDFQPILAGQAIPGSSTGAQPQGAGARPGGPGGAGGTSPFGGGTRTSSSPQTVAQPGRTTTQGTSPIGSPGAGAVGGIMGVVSKSKDKSLRLYNGRSHYNEWAFINTPQQQAPGQGGQGVQQPGQRPGGPGGQGQNPFGGGIGQRPGGPGQGQRPGGPGFPGGAGQRPTGPGGFPIQPGTSPFSPGQTPFGQPQQPQQPVRRPGGL